MGPGGKLGFAVTQLDAERSTMSTRQKLINAWLSMLALAEQNLT